MAILPKDLTQITNECNGQVYHPHKEPFTKITVNPAVINNIEALATSLQQQGVNLPSEVLPADLIAEDFTGPSR